MYQYFANVLPETSIMMTNITADAIRDMSLIMLTPPCLFLDLEYVFVTVKSPKVSPEIEINIRRFIGFGIKCFP